jgi:hypothetical protein
MLAEMHWPIRTQRLALRPATPADAEATWLFRRLESVNRWLTRGTSTLDEYKRRFTEPSSLAKTLIIERDGQVVGDLMAEIQDGWCQTTFVMAMPQRQCSPLRLKSRR